MISLADMVKESLGNKSIEWTPEQIKNAEAALKPLLNTWKPSTDLYDVNKHTANQVAQKMLGDLVNYGFTNYADFQADKVYATHTQSLVKGNGLVIFDTDRTGKVITRVQVYLITDRQCRYFATFTDDGVKASAYRDPSKRPVVADAGAKYIFEVPGEVVEKLFN